MPLMAKSSINQIKTVWETLMKELTNYPGHVQQWPKLPQMLLCTHANKFPDITK
jgi:hypothetical protein